jgi:hypothetical protein
VQWINSTSWLERVNWANFLVTAREDGHTMAPSFGTLIDRYGLTSPEGILDHFADELLDGQISADTRRTVMGYLEAGTPAGTLPVAGTASVAVRGTSRPAPRGAAGLPAKPLLPAFVDQKVRGLVYLLLASPEYQLA